MFIFFVQFNIITLQRGLISCTNASLLQRTNCTYYYHTGHIIVYSIRKIIIFMILIVFYIRPISIMIIIIDGYVNERVQCTNTVSRNNNVRPRLLFLPEKKPKCRNDNLSARDINNRLLYCVQRTK